MKLGSQTVSLQSIAWVTLLLRIVPRKSVKPLSIFLLMRCKPFQSQGWVTLVTLVTLFKWNIGTRSGRIFAIIDIMGTAPHWITIFLLGSALLPQEEASLNSTEDAESRKDFEWLQRRLFSTLLHCASWRSTHPLNYLPLSWHTWLQESILHMTAGSDILFV